jgi:hypothetical protein
MMIGEPRILASVQSTPFENRSQVQLNMKSKTVLKPSMLAMLLLFCAMHNSDAAEYYVAADGSDANAGTLEKPFRTLSHVRDAVRESGWLGNESVTIHLRGGTHYLAETLVLRQEDSGTAECPVSYSAYQDENVVLSGGVKLDLTWKRYQNGTYVAQTPAGLEIDQLFVNGDRQHMARYPNYDPHAQYYNGTAADAFAASRAQHWKNPRGGYIHALHRHHWGGFHYRITGKDAQHKVMYEGGWQNNRQLGMHPDLRMVENIIEELDAAGEWYHDSVEGRLFYMPEADADPNVATVEVVRLKHLVEFQGDRAAPVKHIKLEGLILRHAARTFMQTREPLLRSDWTIYRGGAVLVNGARDCLIADCEFDQVGGNSIFINKYNRRIKIRGCHIHGGGASGICFVGDPGAVRSPRFEYHQTYSYNDIDKTAGPKSDNYPADCLVEDCLIHNMSVVEKQATGIQISMSHGITVRHCSIYDLGRAGINISEGTFGGHVIEFCDVFDTVRETGDHGSFNSWGRDRFWHLQDAPAGELPELSGLDTETTVIRNSRWRCDHGWDVDLDDGSSHYEIYNNLFLKGGLKLREGFHRNVYNNIAINNSLHPHVWYHNSMDVVTGNIWMGAYRPAGGMPAGQWGSEVNRNLFTRESDRDKFRRNGCDVNSIVGDPEFIDPANGDYRVKDESPALKIGFRNFPMDRFGVQKASLKALARTPVIPELNANHHAPSPAGEPFASDVIWLGATLQTLDGKAYSAFGVSREDGGIVLTKVSADSEAARVGLKEKDVIQQVNGEAVPGTPAFLKMLSTIGPRPVQLKIVREQRPLALSIRYHSYVEVESAVTAYGFRKLRLPTVSVGTLTANTRTNNDPLESLGDGKLAAGYGPVFGNGVRHGAYKMDLGRVRPVKAITSWSYRQGQRDAQRLTIYGSRSTEDPGWKLDKLTPIGTIDRESAESAFAAASLRAAAGNSLGEFRWVIWAVSPVNIIGGGENTAFQELHVEYKGEN